MTTALSAPGTSLLDVRMNKQAFPRLHTLGHDEVVSAMMTIVTQAFLYRGTASEPTNVQFIAAALVDELLADSEHVGTANLTFPEISYAVKRSVLNDTMYGISVSTLYKVLVAYCKGEGHLLQLEVNKRMQAQRNEDLKNSVIAPMLQAYAGQIVKNQKNK